MTWNISMYKISGADTSDEIRFLMWLDPDNSGFPLTPVTIGGFVPSIDNFRFPLSLAPGTQIPYYNSGSVWSSTETWELDRVYYHTYTLPEYLEAVIAAVSGDFAPALEKILFRYAVGVYRRPSSGKSPENGSIGSNGQSIGGLIYDPSSWDDTSSPLSFLCIARDSGGLVMHSPGLWLVGGVTRDIDNIPANGEWGDDVLMSGSVHDPGVSHYSNPYNSTGKCVELGYITRAVMWANPATISLPPELRQDRTLLYTTYASTVPLPPDTAISESDISSDFRYGNHPGYTSLYDPLQYSHCATSYLGNPWMWTDTDLYYTDPVSGVLYCRWTEGSNTEKLSIGVTTPGLDGILPVIPDDDDDGDDSGGLSLPLIVGALVLGMLWKGGRQ